MPSVVVTKTYLVAWIVTCSVALFSPDMTSLFLSEPLTTLYVDRENRMTAKHSSEKIDPHIESEKRKLQKSPEQFEKYPESRSKVYEKIGSHYINRWKSSGSPEDLR